MAFADVMQLVADLSQGQADVTTCTGYYTDIVTEIGLTPSPTCVTVEYVPVTAPQAVFPLPANVINLLALAVDDRELPRATIGELWQYLPSWQDRVGSPIVWTAEDTLSKRVFQVVPALGSAGQPLGGLTPFDPNPAPGNITLVGSVTVVDVHPEEELWVALEILAREFSRDSDHEDPNTAQLCRSLASLFRTLVTRDVMESG